MRPRLALPAAPPPADPSLSTEDRATLALLRLLALRCRAAPRETLFEACALLSLDRGATPELFGTALLRCLPEALQRTPELHRPGAASLTFDERWLLALTGAFRREDIGSAQFLLRRRVRRDRVRSLGFLARGLVTTYNDSKLSSEETTPKRAAS